MQNELNKVRFSVKPLKSNDNKVVELARTVGIHPLAYQELPYDPEYSFYAGRLNPEVLSHATADEMYWKVRQEVIYFVILENIRTKYLVLMQKNFYKKFSQEISQK